MTPISQLIFKGAPNAGNDEALEQSSPATGCKTAGANMPSKAASGAGFIATFAEMIAQRSES